MVQSKRIGLWMGLGLSAAFLVGAIGAGASGLRQEKEDERGEKSSGSAFTVAPKAKLNPIQAMRIAEKASHGKAFQATFEFDEGKWVYGVMVKKGAQLFEVELDPVTGKVGDTEKVTPAGEAKEVQSELGKILAK
jgi:hypothetical protein